MNPRDIRIEDFFYELPQERIAVHPLSERDASKLLHYEQGHIHDRRFKELPELLKSGDLLIFNDSKVIHARLIFQTESGHRVEIFCLQPREGYASLAEEGRGSSVWECLVGGNRKWKNGKIRMVCNSTSGQTFELFAERKASEAQGFLIEFEWKPEHFSFSQVLESAGRLPIPPYLNRESEEEDEERYQNVFAKNEGSVAAPTAGLHFTQAVLNELAQKGVQRGMVTLHVGAGTFLPVKAETMSGHHMHDEAVVIDEKLLAQLMLAPRVIAVGTTSMRSLESLYWLAERIRRSHTDQNIQQVEQWDPYELETDLSRGEAIKIIQEFMKSAGIESFSFRTSLMIAPPYRLKMVDALITNFHQPSSTLLLLVAAVCGEDWRKIYAHALKHDYRFLSYGDSSFLVGG